MVGSRPRPRRTLAVALIDPFLDALAAIRGVAGRVVGDDRRLLRGIAIASAAILVGTVVILTVLLRSPDRLAPMGTGPAPDPEVVSTSDTGTPGIGATPAASAPPAPRSPGAGQPAAPPAPPGRASGAPFVLAARFAVEGPTLFNYQASVAISNPGPQVITGWTLVITLPRQTLAISEVSGAQVTRDGATWTFTPDQSTRQLRGGGSAQVRFRVDGAAIGAAPTSCTIDGRPCEVTPSRTAS